MLRSTNLPMFSAIATEMPEILKKIEEYNDPEKQAELQAKQQQMSMGGGMGGAPGAEGAEGAEGAAGGAQPQQPQQDPPTATLDDPKVKANRQVIEECLAAMKKANYDADMMRKQQELAQGQQPQEGQEQGQQNQQQQPQQKKEEPKKEGAEK